MKTGQESGDLVQQVADWGLVFDVLGLERVEPFLPEMGLHLANIQDVRSIVRQAAEGMRQASGNVDQAVGWIRRALHEISAVAGEETAQNLNRWTTMRSHGTAHFPWYWMLIWLSKGAAEESPVVLPAIGARKVGALRRIVRESFRDMRGHYRRIDAAEGLPRSEWDARVYGRWEPNGSPMDMVSNAIVGQRLRLALKRIQETLTEDELEILQQWARAHAQERGLSPESLTLPR